jgi:hypothetical protein
LPGLRGFRDKSGGLIGNNRAEPVLKAKQLQNHLAANRLSRAAFERANARRPPHVSVIAM